MKKYLFIALAAFGFAACAEKIDDTQNPSHNGEVEESYIAINLMATGLDTRAQGDTYQDGLDAERAVNTAYFFFFQNGNPFPVNVSGNAVTAPGATGAVNYLQATLTNPDPEEGDSPNVSDIKQVVLLLKNYKGQYPNQIVTVLNWTPAQQQYTMEELEKATGIKDNNGNFVMSNAVYVDAANNAIEATPLTLANIFTTEADAKASPLKIHVERIAAKVTVTTDNVANNRFDVQTSVAPDGGTATAVYAEVLGWDIYNDYQKSYLLKQIDPSWTVTEIGFNWNDSPFYRSYWATSITDPFEENEFTWGGINLLTAEYEDVAKGTYVASTYTYCGENTYRDIQDRTKVILKARLVDAGGKTIELAKWYGTDYSSEANLRIAVANTLKNTIYYKIEDPQTKEVVYKGIEPDDLQCVMGGDANAPEGVKASEVYFQLSTAGEGKSWYSYSSQGNFATFGDADANKINVNARLKEVPSAIVYRTGQTYYFFDINHLAPKEGDAARYGIVRNHIYSININGIKGLGTPVYDGTKEIVKPELPDTPTETESFVAAEVHILSWRMVQYGVNVGQ